MSNPFRFFCCISSLQVTAEAHFLGSCSEFNYWFFAQEPAGGNILGFFLCNLQSIFAHVSAGSNISFSFRAFYF